MSEFDSLFADDDNFPPQSQTGGWKVMIVDDEEDVHSVTRLALSDFSYDGKGLDFIDAYSGAEALQLFMANRDTCLILLDVVMESQDAGLRLVEQIRQGLGDETVRIILRTGHPGSAPELSVVRSYDISDYKTKSELTAQKLSSALLTALKTYRLLQRLEEKQQSLARLNRLLEEQSSEIVAKKMMIEEIVNRAAQQVIVATDQQQLIRFFNGQATDFFALSGEKVIGQPLSELLVQHGLDLQPLDLALAGQEQQLHLRDGRGGKDMSFRLCATGDGHGGAAGLILMGQTDPAVLPSGLAKPSVAPAVVSEPQAIPGFIGSHPTMQPVFRLIHDLAHSSAPVLVQGESGSGKELVAASIHKLSRRAEAVYLPINCGALPEHLLESELFGHEKGAFTGAIRSRKGLFEQADGGTLFLDEIGEISLTMQVKLLRVLQEGSLQRLGGEKPIQVDVRIISATNKDLLHETEAGRFREDLYYRLCVVPIHLPPLRKRRSDIGPLSRHFLGQVLADEGLGRQLHFSAQVEELLIGYHWPGNARELQNAVHFATVLCRDGEILPEHLPPTLLQDLPQQGETLSSRGIDEQAILEALSATSNNRQEAAKLLGVSRATFYRYLAKFNTDKK